jgi:IS1 family transposase
MCIRAFEVGDGSIKTLEKLWSKINSLVNIACTDGNPTYKEFFEYNIDTRHLVTKSETCLVESYNSVLRYYLARLHRKTKCYSKSTEMLKVSINLLLLKLSIYQNS